MNPLTSHARRLLLAAAIGATALLAVSAGAASAATPDPGLTLTSVGQPTNFSSDLNAQCASDLASSNNHTVAAPDCDTYTVTATNVGAAATDGSPVTLTDTLPAGWSAQKVELYWSALPQTDLGFFCSTTPVQCTLPVPIQSGQALYMVIRLSVDPSTTGTVTNSASASITDDSLPAVSASSQNHIGTAAPLFGIQDVTSSLTGEDGQPDLQAGSHPYQFTTSIDLDTQLINIPATSSSTLIPPQDAKDITVNLPPGLIANPQATPQCSAADFTNELPCPADSQVGMVTISGATPGLSPLYNIAPPPGVAGELGFFSAAGTPVILTAGVRTGSDYGLSTFSGGIPQAGRTTDVSVTVWGVPADPTHTWQRGLVCINSVASPQWGGYTCQEPGGLSSGAPPRPFLTAPTDCSDRSLDLSVSADSWQNPSDSSSGRTSLPALTGCGALTFAPTLSVIPDTSQAGRPAGLSVDLKVPQNDNTPFVYGNGPAQPATGADYSPLSTPELRDATVALPAGVTINPSSGDGLGSCSDAQFAVNSAGPASCPDASKIGTVSLHTPLLDHAMPGDVYVGQPECSPCSPADAASGRMVRLFLQVNDPQSGVIVKLPGSVSITQTTGQLTASFLQSPQLPFDELQLNLKGGPRAPLVNPSTCGLFTTTSDLAPWSAPFSGPNATPSSTFAVTSDCGMGSSFAPTFAAGSTHRQAGAYTGFVLSFSRSDADQFFSGLSVKLPPGVLAKLAGVPLCSDSDANAGSCPSGSQVGTVETGAGAGSEPLFLPGKAYLTGPYKGAPYGLAVEVPAIAGPYNLGTVVVRQALHIDPTTAQVTAVSDQFPTQLDGIPLRIRRVDVNLSRPDFMVNPTSCDPMQITGTLTSTGGMTATVANRFQVGGCAALPFSPKLRMSLTGKGKTRSGDHPTLISTLTARSANEANAKSIRVALPLSLALDPNNSSNVCPFATAQAVHGGAVGCPSSTIVGHATAITPLLSEPLSGPVYLVQGIRMQNGVQIHTLPSLLIPLRGQIAIDLRAQSSVSGGKLVTTFPTIPDAFVHKFTLTINGGKKGILVITGRGRSICGSPQITQANLIAQSGKAVYPTIKMSTPCRASHKKTKRHSHRRAHHTRRHS